MTNMSFRCIFVHLKMHFFVCVCVWGGYIHKKPSLYTFSFNPLPSDKFGPKPNWKHLQMTKLMLLNADFSLS